MSTRVKCDICEKSFARNDGLQIHIKRFHSSQKDFSCTECEKSFVTKEELQRHFKSVHLKQKDFSCIECEKSFVRNSDLQAHFKGVHLKQRDFSCDECKKSFVTTDRLRIHVKRYHLKQKDFSCTECKKSFVTKAELQRHIKRLYSNQRDFSCDECEKSFVTKYDLKRHLKICTGKELMSSGEYKIKNILEENGIKFQRDVSCSELIRFCKKNLRFDFIIRCNNGKKGFIEFNGPQHYAPVRFGGIPQEKAEENFQKQVEHDNLKTIFCKTNEYHLSWIHYNDFENIEKLVLEFFIRINTCP
jgi:uncharacterized Zn-finger protein